MRKIVFILLFICSYAYAQEPVYNQMRNNYQFRGVRVDSLILIPKFTDTANAAYLNGITGALIRVDSSVYMRYNKWLKLNGAASSVDTTSLSNRINQRVKYSDTAVMLNPYLLEADTSSLSFRIDSRVKYTDTSAMLQVYLQKNDTATLSSRIDLKIDSLKKSDDSVYFKKSGNWYFSFRDSVGGGGNGRFGNDTATVVMAMIHNDAGSTLTNGEVVYLSTSGTNSDNPSVKRAINKADSTSANTFGFVHGSIANNDTGWIILSGKIEKLNTSAFANGDIIYLDSIAGKWTKSKPQAPYHLVYLGVVIKANAGNGSIFVKPQNGYEIEELHDVKINGRVNNQIIAYSDTQKVWKNRNVWAVVDTSTWSARIDNKLNISDTSVFLRDSDSSIYQTKYRSDTARANTYSAIAGRDLDFITILRTYLGSTYKSKTFGIEFTQATTLLGLTNQLQYFIPIFLPNNDTIKSVSFFNRNTAVYTGNNYNGFGLYSYSNGTLTLIDSTTNDPNIWKGAITTWSTANFVNRPLSPRGLYFVSFLYCISSSSTNPGIQSAASVTSGVFSGLNLGTYKLFGTVTPRTSLIPSVAMSGISTFTQLPFLLIN